MTITCDYVMWYFVIVMCNITLTSNPKFKIENKNKKRNKNK